VKEEIQLLVLKSRSNAFLETTSTEQ